MKRIVGLSVLLALPLWLSCLGLAIKEYDSCTNPAGEPGQCIFYSECGPITRIYNKTILAPEEVKFINQSICGMTDDKKPLVCCVVAPVNPGKRSTLPKPPYCGFDFSDRIFGGQKTLLDDFPWTALIEYRKPNGNSGFRCGASLINSRYVVTAAHCIKAIPRGWQVIGVRLGEWDLNSDNDCLDGDCMDAPVNMGIEKIIVHENYDPNSKMQYDDIALIRFTRDVHTSTFISPVCLPIDITHRNRNNVGTRAWAVGWGRTETANASNFKLKVELEIQDLTSCSNIYIPAGIVLRDTQFCAGGVREKDTCSGDSGGSLTKLITSYNFLYGIVSFGPNKCGTKGVPGVYTNVAKYVDWIESKLE